MAEAMQGGVMSLPPEMGGMAQPPRSYLTPEDEATLNQLRQSVSKKEFSDEMLNAAEQVDPETVMQLRSMLRGMQLPPELVDLIQQMIDMILNDPGRYQENRAKFLAEGVPEELLPPNFDPEFFAALSMALDQVSGPTVQGFAGGGMVMNPIAGGLASLGRYGDSMLAHITPQEAMMLRRAGGSGSINPATGLPEFFNLFKAIGNAFRSVGNAIKGVVKGIGNAISSFAKSTIGRVVTSVALGFFLGPAAAGLLGVSSAAGVAAISGFVGGAGSTLLAGGSLKDALKTGAIGGLTAGAFSGISGGAGAFKAGSYTGPTTISESWKSFTEKLGTKPATETAKAVSGVADEAAAVAPPPVGTPSSPIESAVQNIDELKADVIGGRTQTVPTATGMESRPLDMAAGPSKFDVISRGSPPAVPPAGPSKFDVISQGSPSAVPPAGPSKFDVISRGSPPAVSPAPPVPVEQVQQVQQVLGEGLKMPGGPAGPRLDAMNLPPPGTTPSASTEGVMSLLKQGEFGKAAEKAYDYISPGAIQKAGTEKALEEAQKAVNALPANTDAAVRTAVFNKVYEANLPGMLATYGPMTAAGLGATYLAGGFDVKPPPKPEIPVSGAELYRQNPYLLLPDVRTISASTGLPYDVKTIYASSGKPYQFATGGIASLAQGSTQFPRKTGPVDGPGTSTSDSIPAMLSDGEFVFTAKAVRAMGKGSRRKGAKRMYALMKALEKRA